MKSGALLGGSDSRKQPPALADPELSAVVAAWSTLPPALRAGIAAIIRAVRPDSR